MTEGLWNMNRSYDKHDNLGPSVAEVALSSEGIRI